MDAGSDVLEVLDDEECFTLLGSAEVGRVGVVIDGQPLIFPVNHVLEGRSIVFRTDSARMLGGASLAKVAFEADGFDAGVRSGWTVLAEGIGNDVTDALDATSEHLQTVPVTPWAPGRKPRLLRIDVRTITGRRFAGERSNQ
jgi:uncharacterized protein